MQFEVLKIRNLLYFNLNTFRNVQDLLFQRSEAGQSRFNAIPETTRMVCLFAMLSETSQAVNSYIHIWNLTIFLIKTTIQP